MSDIPSMTQISRWLLRRYCNSPRMQAYLALEREAAVLVAAADPLADAIRDAMDALWHGLTDEEHAALDQRQIGDVDRPPPSW